MIQIIYYIINQIKIHKTVIFQKMKETREIFSKYHKKRTIKTKVHIWMIILQGSSYISIFILVNRINIKES